MFNKDEKQMINSLEEGVTLHTLSPSKVTNAVYVSCDEVGCHSIISDFGNKMYFSTEELLSLYKLPDWYFEYKEMDYPFETLEERLRAQVELLSGHLAILLIEGSIK